MSGGRLAGILDAGGLGPADPALDLVAAWHLLEARPREALRDDLRCDDLERERGRARADHGDPGEGLVTLVPDARDQRLPNRPVAAVT